jgi:hypothetical protein
MDRRTGPIPKKNRSVTLAFALLAWCPRCLCFFCIYWPLIQTKENYGDAPPYRVFCSGHGNEEKFDREIWYMCHAVRIQWILHLRERFRGRKT